MLFSYLKGRTVCVGKSASAVEQWKFKVQQGYVLDSFLFILNVAPIGNVVSQFGVQFDQYANDTQLYIAKDHHNYDTVIVAFSAVCSLVLMQWSHRKSKQN